MKKLSLLLNVILLGVILYGGYKFLIQGSVAPTDDGRTAILLTGAERDHVLGEMRGFLETVEGVVTGISDNDMQAVAEVASAAGMAGVASEPAALIGKLPLDFKTLGMDTHALFDDLAAAASDTNDPAVVTAKLSTLMQNCTSCHAGYRFDVEGTGK